MNGNAFKAFKAQVPIAWSPHLYITLVRGFGNRKASRRTLEALRLRKCNRTVMRWNTPTIRECSIEAEEMYKARKQNVASHQARVLHLVIDHQSAPKKRLYLIETYLWRPLSY
ncbi:hypothetical protein K2173_008808 [Erythroxylum novogranatense]|uniref:Large ribosomal subunit protein uL30m n=1 Tax=Erythroxylum novogranatense TaxID=1862640 RepID=A0AAV8SL64_9ROSI|nr:hypothetical protein K2173_008808 [Erythroxylum novogranatense]